MQRKSSNNKGQQESDNGPDGTSEVRKRGMRHKRGPRTTQEEAKTGRDLAEIKRDIEDLAARRPENVSPATALMEIAEKIEAMRIQQGNAAHRDGGEGAGRGDGS
ncbi:hypothetical protein K4K59_008378 [Colletotrichum sp. SAR11_240]|nr:hypothetical protein K4K59_008378 [Colletotrichum sp. SAR11_240]